MLDNQLLDECCFVAHRLGVPTVFLRIEGLWSVLSKLYNELGEFGVVA
jgi:hypothetical protein